ncbi:DinB family protein [Candidatus Bipolaricaulota bacterium]|nr:DinB family protein [Candidatus Bipolaricaulota bacterium]
MNPAAKAYWLGLKRSDGFVRFFTSGLEGDDWFKQPCGAPNPPIWILGHLAHSRAQFLEILTGERVYDEGWHDLFAMGVEPQSASSYPSVETIRSILGARKSDLNGYLETANEEDLESPPATSSCSLKTKAEALAHLSHHEVHHTGTLSLLRRQLGKDRLV